MALPFFHSYRGSIGRFFAGDPSLTAYWQLQGSSADNSGNGNTGTDTAVTYNQQSFLDGTGSALFNGSSSKIGISYTTLPVGNSARTFSFWMNPSAIPTTGNTYDTLAYGSAVTDQMSGVGITNTVGVLGILFFGYGDDVVANFAYTTNRWYLITCTFDGTTASVYVNGRYINSANKSSWNTGSAGGFIGAFQTGTSNYFGGKIVDFSIFSRALSDREIYQYYQWAMSQSKKSWLSEVVQVIQSGASFLYEFLAAN